jgi:hypothetical protein
MERAKKGSSRGSLESREGKERRRRKSQDEKGLREGERGALFSSAPKNLKGKVKGEREREREREGSPGPMRSLDGSPKEKGGEREGSPGKHKPYFIPRWSFRDAYKDEKGGSKEEREKGKKEGEEGGGGTGGGSTTVSPGGTPVSTPTCTPSSTPSETPRAKLGLRLSSDHGKGGWGRVEGGGEEERGRELPMLKIDDCPVLTREKSVSLLSLPSSLPALWFSFSLLLYPPSSLLLSPPYSSILLLSPFSLLLHSPPFSSFLPSPSFLPPYPNNV